MRILCIGDSLGLPRKGCSYENTWFYKISENFPDHEFFDIFFRSMLITQAYPGYYDSYYKWYKPDVLIIQTGICDCAPRHFNDLSLKGRITLKIVRIFKLSNLFWKIVKKRDRASNRVYTSLELFEEKYNGLIESFVKDGISKIIVIKIGHGSSAVLNKSQYFNDNVDKYNKCIDGICLRYQNIVTVIDPLNKVLDDNFVDGYHCNEKGMNLVYSSLKNVLEDIISSKKTSYYND